MNLLQAIQRNRHRQARFRKAERLLRDIRLRIFDYQDQGKGEQAERIMERCKAILNPLWAARKKALGHRKVGT